MKEIEKFAIQKALQEDNIYEEKYLEHMRIHGEEPDEGFLSHYSPMGFIGSLLLAVEPSELIDTVNKWFEDFEHETNLHKEDILAICTEYFEKEQVCQTK